MFKASLFLKFSLKQNVERDATPMLYSKYEARWDRIYKESGRRLIYVCDMEEGKKYIMWEMTKLQGFFKRGDIADTNTHCDYASWPDWKHCKTEAILT
jgi:hypothetical protein